MVTLKKLTHYEHDIWMLKFAQSGKPSERMAEHYMTENFPGHVDHRLDGVSASEQERIIVDNYVIPRDST